MFSAYNIKKILPRLIIATILIQLSWWLCIQAIALNNSIAHGIEGLMYAPFGGAANISLASVLAPKGGGAAAAAATSGVAIVSLAAVSVTAGSGTVVGLLALAGTALLGTFLALFLLVVRRVVIIFLVLTVPIAIVAWILPGTQKLWKLWWESFIKLLLVYPMILGLIAAGKIAAYIVSNTKENNFLSFFIIVICYFGPFFLIPALLKLSGAAFATITGAVNNKGKGAFDRLRNVRSKEAEKNKAKFMAGERFNEHSKNPFARGVNNLGRRASVGLGGRFGYGKRGQAMMESQAAISAAELEKRNQLFAINKEDEKVMKLLAMNANRTKAQQWISNKANEMRSKGKTDSEISSFQRQYSDALETASAIGFNNNTRRAALMSGGAISYGFEEGQKGWNEATQAMREIAGVADDQDPANNQTYRNLTNQFQYLAKGAGRADLSGATDGGDYNGYRAWTSVGLYQHGNGKPSSIKGSANYFEELLGKTQTMNFDKQDVMNFGNLSTEEKAKYEAYSAGDTSALTVDQLGDIKFRTRLGAQKASAVFVKEMATLGSSASGSVRDEALRQKARLESSIPQDILNSPEVSQQVRGYDPEDVNRRRNAGDLT